MELVKSRACVMEGQKEIAGYRLKIATRGRFVSVFLLRMLGYFAFDFLDIYLVKHPVLCLNGKSLRP